MFAKFIHAERHANLVTVSSMKEYGWKHHRKMIEKNGNFKMGVLH